jgi:hypothetical protein
MTQVLEVQLMVEVTEGDPPLWTATVPAFRLHGERFQVLAQGETAGAALRQLNEQLDDLSKERTTETIQAEPLQRVDTDG